LDLLNELLQEASLRKTPLPLLDQCVKVITKRDNLRSLVPSMPLLPHDLLEKLYPLFLREYYHLNAISNYVENNYLLKGSESDLDE